MSIEKYTFHTDLNENESFTSDFCTGMRSNRLKTAADDDCSLTFCCLNPWTKLPMLKR